MARSQITIHHCGFDSRPCDNYVCRRSKRADGSFMRKYYVGDPSATGHKPIFCEDCVSHLVRNLPPELVEGGEELEARIRSELEKEYAEKLERALISDREKFDTEIAALRATIETLQNPSAEKDRDPESAPLVGVEPAAPEEENDGTEFRCLDCGAVFDKPHGLIVHQRMKHKSVGKE